MRKRLLTTLLSVLAVNWTVTFFNVNMNQNYAYGVLVPNLHSFFPQPFNDICLEDFTITKPTKMFSNRQPRQIVTNTPTFQIACLHRQYVKYE
jgi:hypothetical protein